MRATSRRAVVAAAAFAAVSGFAFAQTTEEEVQKYRKMVAQDNPGELWEIRGETLFKQRRGAKNASLEQCDFGWARRRQRRLRSPAALFRRRGPRDGHGDRLVHCMVTLQDSREGRGQDQVRQSEPRIGRQRSPPTRRSRSDADRRAAGAREGTEAYKIGETLFYRRMSKMDFACATCHADQGKRIRLQDLYNATNKKEIDTVMSGWPAYRVSNSTVRTMQHRLFDCGWQMRLPNVEFGSEWTVALHTYLSHSANGAKINVPGMRR